MARPAKLSDVQILSEIERLDGWDLRDGRLHRAFHFDDFIEAWGFMSRVALVAQAMDHHPDWTNVSCAVEVNLSTHDAGGITILDFELARKIDLLA